MNLTSALDYVIAITGILIIVISFGWNIYDVFLRKAIHISKENTSSQSADSAIR